MSEKRKKESVCPHCQGSQWVIEGNKGDVCGYCSKSNPLEEITKILEINPRYPRDIKLPVYDDRKQKLIDAINRLADIIEKKQERDV